MELKPPTSTVFLHALSPKSQDRHRTGTAGPCGLHGLKSSLLVPFHQPASCAIQEVDSWVGVFYRVSALSACGAARASANFMSVQLHTGSQPGFLKPLLQAKRGSCVGSQRRQGPTAPKPETTSCKPSCKLCSLSQREV